ncbi:MAG TPA: DUF6314 family protein [Gemmatimonadales bacterium]|nr:DUF6314 family protein [Gemmatimonadales bacterium]
MSAPIAPLWRALGAAHQLRFTLADAGRPGWSAAGSGAVRVEHPDEATLVFHESGDWRSNGGDRVRFRNALRWTRLDAATLRLEHLRFGETRPVHILDLVPDTTERWRAAAPHVCADDLYHAELELCPPEVRVRWRVTGPATDETIEHRYLCHPPR